MTFLKTAGAWLSAALLSAVTTSFVSTHQVLNALGDVGASIELGQRLSMMASDLGILQALFPVVAASFLVGFCIAELCTRFIFNKRQFWFILAGASSIVCTLLLMSYLMNLMPVAGARSLTGQIAIGVCGALGGLLFFRLTNRTASSPIE